MSDPLALEVAVDLGKGTLSDDLDQAARDLVTELEASGLASAVLKTAGSEAPNGAKGSAPVTIGTVVITALPIVLPKLLDVLKSWVERSKRRQLTVRGSLAGRAVQFKLDASGMTGDELARIVDKITQGGAAAPTASSKH